MPIISKETWEKFTQEEKVKVKKVYKNIDSTLNGKCIDAGGMKHFMNTFFGKEQLQPKPLTYEDVARELFKDGAWQTFDGYMGDEFGEFNKDATETFPWNMTSRKHCEKLLAINKLLNVAKFLNGKDWKPDWFGIEREQKWVIKINRDNEIKVQPYSRENVAIVYFRTEALAKQAIEILSEDTVRLALSTDW